MFNRFLVFLLAGIFLSGLSVSSEKPDIGQVFNAISSEVSGNRARDYVMRQWIHEKWNTLPAWKRSIEEIRLIMEERGFEDIVLGETPADGKTMFGGWTSPVGWDVKQATLEIIDPVLPDEYRYLCNFLDNPTSLNAWSAPTPPEGIETELVLWEGTNPAELATLNARGKIVLTGVNTRTYKRWLDPNGILGFLGDIIEPNNVDFIHANQWLNGWSDIPGGWWMTIYDSQNNFGFSISKKKADYLRDLMRKGTTIRVRVKIDSRYYTDDTLPHISGIVRGSGPEGEEVFITGHTSEWGANDNCSGVAAILEGVGVLNDLIESGKLPRPRRSIRVLLGPEMYGSLPWVQENLSILRDKTVAAICCDTSAGDFDASNYQVNIYMNPNVCPTWTDAVYPEIVRLYLDKYYPGRIFAIRPFQMGTDTYFCEPMIGVPTNWIYTGERAHLHHNSMDTIETVDVRSLKELSFLNAAYMYFVANADDRDIPWIANLTFARGIEVIRDKALQQNDRIAACVDGVSLGKALADGIETIEYYTELQKQAMQSMLRLVPESERRRCARIIKPYSRSLDEIGASLTKQLRANAEIKAAMMNTKVTVPRKTMTDWDREASKLVPKRFHFATLFLAEVPVSEWREITITPRWWAATDWSTSSFWWVDGKRSLLEIKRLCELEAGIPVENFDLINYYRFLEKFGYIEFVK